MAKIRKFLKHSEKERMKILFKMLSYALVEDNTNWKTDAYGIARQYGGSFGVKKEDFDMIKNMTIDEIVQKITQEDNE